MSSSPSPPPPYAHLNPPSKPSSVKTNSDGATSIVAKSLSSSSNMSNQSTIDTLRYMAGSGIRRSKCQPEFLEKLAKDTSSTELDKDVVEKLKIITGEDGTKFFRKFIEEEPLDAGLKSEKDKEELRKMFSNPVVFAVCVIEAGRKLVDYYMTWRGMARPKDLKGTNRRADLFDEEFRRVARSLDKEYKRQQGDPDSHKSGKRLSTSSSHKRAPPNIVVSEPKAAEGAPPATPTVNRPSPTNASVISLPFLGAIRNVPLSNRLPLRVTNPDRNSLVPDSPVVAEAPVTQLTNKNNSLGTLVESSSELAENIVSPSSKPNSKRQDSADTLVQSTDPDQMLGPPKKDGDEDSVSSNGSRHPRSSRSKSHKHGSRRRSSSRKRGESTKDKTDHRERDHLSSPRHKDDHKEHDQLSSPRRRDKNEDDDHSTRHRHHDHDHGRHRRSRSRSSRHHDEKRKKDDEGDKLSHKSSRKHSTRSEKREKHDDRSSRKSSRSSRSMKRPLKSNITVVMVDPDQIDKLSLQEVKPKGPTQPRRAPTWHGLAELPRASKPAPALPNTPWIGPLARESVGVRNIHPYKSDSDSDNYWENVPGIPKREPIIPPPVDDWDSDDSDLSFSPVIPHHPRYAPSDVSAHNTPVYPDSNLLSPQGSLYGPQTPVIPPSSYVYASPNNSNHTLFPTMTMHGTPAYGSGYMQPMQLAPSPTASMTSLPHTGFTPGYIPQLMISPAGSMNSSLPGMHEQAYLHGMNSPYSPSAIRSLLGSPYVPAWISPQPSTLDLTPTPSGFAPLHPVRYV